MNKKKKYYAIFVLKEQGIFSQLGKRRFNPANTSVRFRKRTYVINTAESTFISGLKSYFIIDIRTGQTTLKEKKKDIKAKQLGLEKNSISPEMVDMVISRKIISQLTSNLSGTALRMNLLNVFIGVVIGALGGYIYGGLA